jgi:hypothetical protein
MVHLKRWQTATVEVEAIRAGEANDIAFDMYVANAGDIDWELEEYDFAIEDVEEVAEAQRPASVPRHTKGAVAEATTP